MNTERLKFLSHLDEEHLYRQARDGYKYQLVNNPHLEEELGAPLSTITLVERYVQVTFPKAWGPTVEVRVDIVSEGDQVIGYYAMVLEENFSLQDDFFVIH